MCRHAAPRMGNEWRHDIPDQVESPWRTKNQSAMADRAVVGWQRSLWRDSSHLGQLLRVWSHRGQMMHAHWDTSMLGPWLFQLHCDQVISLDLNCVYVLSSHQRQKGPLCCYSHPAQSASLLDVQTSTRRCSCDACTHCLCMHALPR